MAKMTAVSVSLHLYAKVNMYSFCNMKKESLIYFSKETLMSVACRTVGLVLPGQSWLCREGPKYGGSWEARAAHETTANPRSQM